MSVNVIFIGFGDVNQVFCDIIMKKERELYKLLHKKIIIVGVCDSKGALFCQNGFDIGRLISLKNAGKSVINYDGNDIRRFKDIYGMITDGFVGNGYDILIDAAPMNLIDGKPSYQANLYALNAGKKVILANKSSLVVGFDDMMKAGIKCNNGKWSNNLRYSSTVCGGMPVINVLIHDVLPNIQNITKITGLFNSTTNYILTRLHKYIDDENVTFNSVLKEMQDIGVAEEDPNNDIKGIDSTCKLIIIMRSIGINIKKDDVKMIGIDTITRDMIRNANKINKCYKLVSTAMKNNDNKWIFYTKPELVDVNSFIGQTIDAQHCIEIYGDLFETIYLKIEDKDVTGTSAAVLRDFIALELNDQHYGYLYRHKL